jgi:hypothetical protein
MALPMMRSTSFFGAVLAALALGLLVGGCGSSVDGLFTSGGAPNASGGSGVSVGGSAAVGGGSATGGGSSSGGSATTSGGASSTGGGGAVGGNGTIGGGSSVGGNGAASGSGPIGGGTSTGGDTSTGGSAGGGNLGGTDAGGSGGSGTAGTSAGGIGGTTSAGGNGGGSSGAGGSGGNSSCQDLQSLAADELAAARACDNSHNAEQCTGKVSTTCGCQVPVESADSDATKAYLATLKRFQNKGCSVACSALVCLPIQHAQCQSQGQAAGMCVGISGPITQ